LENEGLVTYIGLFSCTVLVLIKFTKLVPYKLKLTDIARGLCPWDGLRTVKQAVTTRPASTLHPNLSSKELVDAIHTPDRVFTDCDERIDGFGPVGVVIAGISLMRGTAFVNADRVTTAPVGKGTLTCKVAQITFVEQGKAELC